MAGSIAYRPVFAEETICSLCRQDVVDFRKIHPAGGGAMKIRKKVLDFEYEEVLDARVRELIRVGCAVAVGCPT
jgi:alkylhydroperoxidase/carboxymuconolactone decarboxylase family protein YurZ